MMFPFEVRGYPVRISRPPRRRRVFRVSLCPRAQRRYLGNRSADRREPGSIPSALGASLPVYRRSRPAPGSRLPERAGGRSYPRGMADVGPTVRPRDFFTVGGLCTPSAERPHRAIRAVVSPRPRVSAQTSLVTKSTRICLIVWIDPKLGESIEPVSRGIYRVLDGFEVRTPVVERAFAGRTYKYVYRL